MHFQIKGYGIAPPTNSVVYADKWALGISGTANDVELSANTTNIGSGAFSNCSFLQRVWIPQSVTNIGAYAFANCPLLTIYAQAASPPSGWDANWNYSNCPIVWNSPAAYFKPITELVIYDVSLPEAGGKPTTEVTSWQYAGTITWLPTPNGPGGTFATNTSYTATITLIPENGYTVQGLKFFTVAGATSGNTVINIQANTATVTS